MESADQKSAKSRHVPKSEWLNLGLSESMSIEEAKERIRQLNAQNWIRHQETRRNNIQARLQTEAKQETAWLPPLLVKEFEEKKLENLSSKKTRSHWHGARRVLLAIDLDPSEWCDNPEAIYTYFRNKRYSPDYVQKILRIMNMWGYFYCRKVGTPFYPVKAPVGFHRERIADAYYDKNQDGMTSDPLTPEMLEDAKKNLLPQNYNWLWLSVWLGLRPQEIDALRDRKNWKVEPGVEFAVLWIYQSKLKSVPRDKRWKLIPLLLEQQKQSIALITNGSFKRPLAKSLHKHFGPRIHLYGGRKNFLPMMLDKGYRLEDIAAWMGHTHIETSWKHYRDRLRVSYRKVG